MKILDEFRKNRFRTLLFSAFGGVFALGIALLSLIWVLHSWRAIASSVHRDLRIIASRTAGEIDQYLSGKMDALKGIRELLSYPDEDAFKLSLMLKRISYEFNQFNSLSLFDASNRLIASSKPDGNADVPLEALDAAKKGQTYRSPMLFNKNSLPYMRVAFPIYWQGEVFRVIVADIDIMTVWNKIDWIKIGETGRASVISESGVFLADRDKGRVLKRQGLKDYIALKGELKGNDGHQDTYGRDGRSLDLAYAEIPSTGWKLIITQEHAESMHFLLVMIYNAVFIMLIVLVAAYYVASLLSQKLSGPVEELHKGVEEVAKGNFKYMVPELHIGEFAALADNFNFMIRSIAEKEKTEKALAGAERFAAIGRLAADVSHEINNPLAIIKNYLYIISKKRMDEKDPNQKYLTIIDGEIDRIARIIHQFNDLYTGSLVKKEEEFNLSVPLNEVLNLCREDLEEKGISLIEHVSDDGKITGDKDKLKQVFLNLVKNAGEAMPDGGNITVETRKENGRIFIDVADTGTGIAPENIEKIFNPFFSTKGVKGFGLGLSVTHGIIKNHGGDIVVESEVGKGTTFKVVLPTAA